MGAPNSTATFNVAQTPVVLRRPPSPDFNEAVYLLNIPVKTKGDNRLANSLRTLLPQKSPLPRSLDGEDVDAKTWRRIEFLAWKADEETCDIVLLRPTWWIEHTGARVGHMIRLAMPEMGVDGPAKVLSIGPCTRTAPPTTGTQIVTGTFRHKAKSILHLHLVGLDKPIGVTPNHPMFSLDQNDFVSAGKLRVGEHLKTRTGVSAVIERIDVISGEQPVYNLEVHKDHVYFVSKLGVLVHNSYVDADSVSLSDRNLQKIYTKHGEDFGLTGNWDPSKAEEMRTAITDFLNSPNVKAINGSYRGRSVINVVDPNTGLNAIIEPGSKFLIGAWKLSPEQLASVLSTGRLF